jgi:hypothetical protein
MINNFKLEDKESYIMIILLIEIGKNFLDEKENCFTSTEEIIKKGLENMKENKKEIK